MTTTRHTRNLHATRHEQLVDAGLQCLDGLLDHVRSRALDDLVPRLHHQQHSLNFRHVGVACLVQEQRVPPARWRVRENALHLVGRLAALAFAQYLHAGATVEGIHRDVPS